MTNQEIAALKFEKHELQALYCEQTDECILASLRSRITEINVMLENFSCLRFSVLERIPFNGQN